MLDTDAAWLAAAIDGEGSIVTQARTTQFLGERRQFHISVYNTSRPFVDHAATLLGGGVSTRQLALAQAAARARGIGLHPRKQYFWTTATARADVERVLLAVRPFLIIKAEKADAVLAWLNANPPVDRAAVSRAWQASRNNSSLRVEA
jgi:hypothetical protein